MRSSWRAGRRHIRRDDLSFDSPYNTYRYAGLPPGPIASPGLASLDAVVHPVESECVFRQQERRIACVLENADGHNQNVSGIKWSTPGEGQEGWKGRKGGTRRTRVSDPLILPLPPYCRTPLSLPQFSFWCRTSK
jgi:hypothetical protein